MSESRDGQLIEIEEYTDRSVYGEPPGAAESALGYHSQVSERAPSVICFDEQPSAYVPIARTCGTERYQPRTGDLARFSRGEGAT